MDKNGIYLQLYKRAPAPNRDYYGLTITKKDVILNIWNITHGPHVFPKKRKCPLQEFPQDRGLKSEVERLFGGHVVDYCDKLSRHDPKLECMPTRVFLYILRHLATNDVLNLGQTSKIFFELCNSDSSWKLLFKKRAKKRSNYDDYENADVRGWRNMLMTKILLQERTPKKPTAEKPQKTKSSKITQDVYKSRIINAQKRVSFHAGSGDKKEDATYRTILNSESSSLLLRKNIRDCWAQKESALLETERLKVSMSNIIPERMKIPLKKSLSAEKDVNNARTRKEQNLQSKSRDKTAKESLYEKESRLTQAKQFNESFNQTRAKQLDDTYPQTTAKQLNETRGKQFNETSLQARGNQFNGTSAQAREILLHEASLQAAQKQLDGINLQSRGKLLNGIQSRDKLSNGASLQSREKPLNSTSIQSRGKLLNEASLQTREKLLNAASLQTKERPFDAREKSIVAPSLQNRAKQSNETSKNPFKIPDSFYDMPTLKKPQKLFRSFSGKTKPPVNLNNAKVVNEFKEAVNNKSNLVQSKSDVNFINNKKDFTTVDAMRAKSAKEKNVNLKNGGSLKKGKGFSLKLK